MTTTRALAVASVVLWGPVLLTVGFDRWFRREVARGQRLARVGRPEAGR